ncbi:Uncharacterised protein [Legionella busanensis]|uniref:Uncharacterized protein n=1 Tax=Legionella busanensis TaxID=190655 RepID=A0A378JJU9_9GAMM|nr:hypothetical protein [Legionella busanensis]STX51347.1 Uncharacterised protein [Legionella busanensis]
MKIKQKGLLSLIAIALSSSCFATDLASRHYEFKPNEAKVLTNPFIWQLTMKCKLSTKSNKNILSALMLKYTGTVNNHVLKEGERVSLRVKNNGSLNISVAGSAMVEITNQGSTSVTANCEIQS